MFKLGLYILGVWLTSLGLFFTIIYLNLLGVGYTILDFGEFIIKGPVFWCLFLGLLFIGISLERWLKNELLLRHSFKLERKRHL